MERMALREPHYAGDAGDHVREQRIQKKVAGEVD